VSHSTLPDHIATCAICKVRTQHLVGMAITNVSTVDRGANGREFAVLKRDPIARPAVIDERMEREILAKAEQAGRLLKSIPTFATLIGAKDVAAWLPPALDALATTIQGALYLEDDGSGKLTTDVRLDSVRASLAEFTSAVLEHVAGSVVKRHAVGKQGLGSAVLRGSATISREIVPVGKRGRWAGVL
jgi:hypothetical protein